MAVTTLVVLDILKPHQPNAIDFCQRLASIGDNYHINLTLIEMDEKTANVKVTIDGDDLDFNAIVDVVTEMGGSVHSIDGVEVYSASDQGS